MQADELATIAQQGIDVSGQRPVANGIELDMVLDQAQADRLRGRGVDLKLTRVKGGKTVREFAAEQAANGFNVWRSYDEPGGIRDQLYAAARNNPQLVKLEVLGHTGQGREIIAVKLTQGAREQPDGTRPAVLYSSTQHAREWISTEVNRRLMNHYIDRWRANDRAVRKLLQTTELWFILVANPDGARPAVMYMSNIHAREWISVEVNRRLLNWFVDEWRANNRNVRKWLQTREIWFVLSANPDGYQYTFDAERLWRKNLRDNDGNGIITVGDGIDLNRNYETKWGWDNEGSSAITASDTYRVPRPRPSPRRRSRRRSSSGSASSSCSPTTPTGLCSSIRTDGRCRRRPRTTRSMSPTPGRTRSRGTGLDPGVAADLYMTNGTTDDYSYSETGALSWTPELNEGCEGCGFVFPDDEALVEAEFERNRPFALDLVRSALDPGDPKSHLGNMVEDFYLDMAEVDPEKSNNPMSDFTFDVSYGDPQPVRVLAKRGVGEVTLKYQINSGPVQSKPTSEWAGGDRWGEGGDYYYHVVEGLVSGHRARRHREGVVRGHERRDERLVRIRRGVGVEQRRSALAAEDYPGISPAQPPGPHYLSYYTDALAANGIGHDIYDVDARGRVAPSLLGVLSHDDAVVWYTGDDIITRDAGMIGETASRLANDEMLAVRAFLNEGGRLLYTGKYAGLQYAAGTRSTWRGTARAASIRRRAVRRSPTTSSSTTSAPTSSTRARA